MPHWRIVLEILGVQRNGSWRSIRYNLRVNDDVRIGDIVLKREQIENMEAIGQTYRSLFDTRSTPRQVKAAQLKALGVQLFKLWLEPHWQRLTEGMPAASRNLLVVASDQSGVLNLPWELLRVSAATEGDADPEWPIGVDKAWGVCRFPFPKLSKRNSSLEPGRLRVLFLAASPRNFPELDYEREEELLLGAVGSSAHLEIGDLGTFKELEDRVDAFRPHIVHLSGHATTSEDGAAFAFESEAGNADLKSAGQLSGLFRGSGVRCVFVSGCATAIAPSRDLLGGLCQSLVANGVPLAVGWAASIVDQVAIRIAKSFYSTLVSGRDVDYALASARSSVWDDGPGFGDPSWSLPVLYALVPDMRVYDETREIKPADEKLKSSDLNRPLPDMAEGYARQFTGRRRELQAILSGLRDDKYGVIITGMDGTGKSSLATRLVRRLERDGGREGRTPIVVSCKRGEPTKAKELFDKVSLALLRAKSGDDAELIRDARLPDNDRLQAVIDGLNKSRFTLVLDGFDNNLDPISRKFHNGDIKFFYERLLAGLVGDTRVVITSRFLPAGIKLPEPRFLELNLGELSETAYLKFLLRDDELKAKYLANELTRPILLDLRRRFGSAPRFVTQMRDQLGKLDGSVLSKDMEARARSRTDAPGPALDALEKLHAIYCDGLGLDESCGDLGDQSVKMIRRTAVHSGPLTLNAIVKVGAGASPQVVKDEIGRWRNSALVHVELGSEGKLWSIYGTLRGWLAGPSRLADPDWRTAHKAAAEFFRTIADGLKDGERHAELQLNKPDCLLASRTHYLSIADSAPALEVSVSLNKILLAEHRYDELIQLNKELLDYVPHPEPATWVARAYLRRPNYKCAEQWYDQALKLADDTSLVQKGQALQGLAVIAWHEKNDEAKARGYLKQALEIQRPNNDIQGEAATIHQLGSIDFDNENYVEARSKFEQVLKLLEGKEPTEDKQATLHQLGSIELQEGHLEEAKKKLETALRIAKSLRDTKAEADAVHQLGRVAAKAGQNPWLGLSQIETALKLRQQIGDGSREAQSFRRIGELLAEAGEQELAIRFLIVSHYLYETLSDAKRGLLASIVQQEAAKLKLGADALEKLTAEVQQAYLRDRGERLLLAASEAMPQGAPADNS